MKNEQLWNMLICENESIRIRSFLPGDAPLIFAYSQEASTYRELPDEVFDSLEETKENLVCFNRFAKEMKYPLVFCVADANTNLPLGHVSLSSLGEKGIEIGYAIGEAHQGKGYGQMATALFTQWALGTQDLPVLYGIVKENNSASIRCLEKAGFSLVKQEERNCFGGRYMIREYRKQR